jgi:hypothetical protein
LQAANPPVISLERQSMPQLAKQHRDELAPAAETAGVALGLVLPDGSLELQPRQQLQHLRRNARYSLHGGSLLGLTSILAKQAQPTNTAATRYTQKLIWTSLTPRKVAFR